MEPISAVASAITIVGTADGIFKMYQNIKKFMKVPDTMDSLVEEVEILRTLVQDLKKAQEILKEVRCFESSNIMLIN